MQSILHHKLHVGIIMDGNGRWAAARGLSRAAGHKAGAEIIRPIVEAAPGFGIGVLTLYAFSSDNWRRPKTEIGALMKLFRDYLLREARQLADTGVRLDIIGRRDRLSKGLVNAIDGAEATTAHGEDLRLRIALDYSARASILRAARSATPDEITPHAFSRLVAGGPDVGDVDLIIRTGGEHRLSDFLLWESAYAELYFEPRMWPDFGPEELAEAMKNFRRRERRFGGLLSDSAAA